MRLRFQMCQININMIWCPPSANEDANFLDIPLTTKHDQEKYSCFCRLKLLQHNFLEGLGFNFIDNMLRFHL